MDCLYTLLLGILILALLYLGLRLVLEETHKTEDSTNTLSLETALKAVATWRSIRDDKAKTSIQSQRDSWSYLEIYEGMTIKWAGHIVDVMSWHSDLSNQSELMVAARFDLAGSTAEPTSLTLYILLPYDLFFEKAYRENPPLSTYEESLASYSKGQPIWFTSKISIRGISLSSLKDHAEVRGTISPRNA